MAETAENINVSIPKQSLVGMIERMKNVTVLLIPQLEQEQNARSATGDDLSPDDSHGQNHSGDQSRCRNRRAGVR